MLLLPLLATARAVDIPTNEDCRVTCAKLKVFVWPCKFRPFFLAALCGEVEGGKKNLYTPIGCTGALVNVRFYGRFTTGKALLNI